MTHAVTHLADAAEISSLADLFATAYRIEIDAVERYRLLADQMETHNNAELAAMFLDLARAEGLHAEEIRRLAGDTDIAARAAQVGTWQGGDSPEQADLASAHYLMTPWHALQMALAGEERALAFFQSVVESANDPKVKALAEEFVNEETEHVELCHRLLRKHKAPPDSWAQDPDPPIGQE
jgi:rubrerythrin